VTRDELDPRAVLLTAATSPEQLRTLMGAQRSRSELSHTAADVAETAVALLYRSGLDHLAVVDLILDRPPDS
jgi:hypothetical protein